MPLLPLEPFIHTKEILSGPLPEVDGPQRWWLLHTRPRAEKALARRMLSQEICFFLPLYKRTWRSRNRFLTSYLPLFSGYLFLCGDGQARQRALETNLVANCLVVGDQARMWADLARVYALMASGSALSPEDRLVPGTRVEIVSGSLTGIQGKIAKRGTQLRFFVDVDFLQQGVSIEIESWMLRPLDTPPPASAVR